MENFVDFKFRQEQKDLHDSWRYYYADGKEFLIEGNIHDICINANDDIRILLQISQYPNDEHDWVGISTDIEFLKREVNELIIPSYCKIKGILQYKGSWDSSKNCVNILGFNINFIEFLDKNKPEVDLKKLDNLFNRQIYPQNFI